MNEKLIKNRRRVLQHGEVFTPSWMVDLMLKYPKDRGKEADNQNHPRNE